MSGEPGGKVRNKPGPRAKWFLTRFSVHGGKG